MNKLAKGALILIGLAIIIFFFYSKGFNPEAFLAADPLIFFGAIIVFMATFFFLGIRQVLLFKSTGGSIRLADAIRAEFVARFVVYTLPSKLSVPVKALYVSGKTAIPKTKSISVLTIEYILDITIMILFVLIGIYYFFVGIPSESISGFVLFAGAIVLICVGFMIMPEKRLARLTERAQKSKRKLAKISFALLNVVCEAKKDWRRILLGRQSISIIILTVLNVILAAAMQLVLFYAYGYQVPLTYVIVVSTTSLFIGGISQIPGGLGIRDASSVYLYVLLGVSEAGAMNVAIATRILTIIPIVVGYLFSANLLEKKSKGIGEKKA